MSKHEDSILRPRPADLAEAGSDFPESPLQDTATAIQALLEEVLQEAENNNASDIHLDPFNGGYDVKFRIDGSLQKVRSLEPNRGLHLLRSFKSQASLDPGFSLRAQSGRAEFSVNRHVVSVRTSTAPGVRGEKLALRLLSDQRAALRLHELGISEQRHADLMAQIPDIRGLMLVSGPAGAGKTTTLYALMGELKQQGHSIVTLEDPVELIMEGVTQIQVNERQGLDFDEGAKSVLRLDPDVIVLGEMRDAPSARAALHAADTGHVCLSTLHARDSAGTITALRNFGWLDHEIAASLDMIISQRLVRRLCQKCRRQEAPLPGETAFISSLGQSPPALVWHPSGCEHCRNSGYSGRIGIFEIHRMTESDADLILAHADEGAIRRHFRQGGSRSLIQELFRDIEDGVTSIAEFGAGGGWGFFKPSGQRKRHFKQR
jgi:type II secretory ATPase GspE/PulE/Tfp pilus assembly ATPase PilB-like protein